MVRNDVVNIFGWPSFTVNATLDAQGLLSHNLRAEPMLLMLPAGEVVPVVASAFSVVFGVGWAVASLDDGWAAWLRADSTHEGRASWGGRWHR